MMRVLPRDAFNDANLLKCIAQLTLGIENGLINLKYEYDGEPFDMVQDPTSGATYIANINFFTPQRVIVHHRRPLNSRDPWPLLLYFGDVNDSDNEYYAFTDNGVFMPDFATR